MPPSSLEQLEEFGFVQIARCVFVKRTPSLAGRLALPWASVPVLLSRIIVKGFVKMREIRNRFVGLRFTDSEFENLRLKMELSGYRSISIYIRDMLLSTRIRRRSVYKADPNLERQLTMLRSEIRKIGVNYNQRVKTLNALSKRVDKKGRPIINARDIDRDMLEMKKMMESMTNLVNEAYSRVMETDSPGSGDSNN